MRTCSNVGVEFSPANKKREENLFYCTRRVLPVFLRTKLEIIIKNSFYNSPDEKSRFRILYNCVLPGFFADKKYMVSLFY
jgi:hypothetical protein